MNKGQSSTAVGRDGSPSDLELMQYFDGELDEPRRSVVEAFLSADLQARNKVHGMQTTSAIVRSEVASLSAADDIAERVMARIAAESSQVTSAVPVIPAAGNGLSGAVQLPGAGSARPSPANDNSRRIFAVLGALAVAAAAAFSLWNRSGPAPMEPVKSGPVAVMTVPTPSPVATSTEPEIDAAGLSADVDAEHGVEVAAVDFGAHMGSIFYVPSGSIEAKRVTTVVWLADDAGE
jgi:anti-sigma factor RsiW